MTTRTLTIAALVLWVLTVAGGAWLFFRGYTQPSADGRTAILLAPPERDIVLAEMRNMLTTVLGVVTALAADDRAGVAAAARRSGMAATNVTPALAAKIPQSFMQMGMGVHRGFDELAAAADAGNPLAELTGRVSAQLGVCVACHASYRIAGQEGA
jgi:hypothetical protein